MSAIFASPTHPSNLVAKGTLELVTLCTTFQNPFMSLFIIDFASALQLALQFHFAGSTLMRFKPQSRLIH